MKRLVLWLLLLVVCAGGVWFFLQHKNNKLKYITVRVERGELSQQVVATGVVNAVTTVQVGSQVSGRIIKLYADFNSQVKKGDLIAELDSSIFQAQVNQARASLENANASVLVQTANIQASLASMENARLGIESAKASVVSAKSDVARLYALKEDARRNWERNEELLKRSLISKGDRDTARATFLAMLAQWEGAKAQTNVANERLRQAGAQYRTTHSQSIAARAQLKSAEAQVKQAAASLEMAETNFHYTKIYAPVNGIVVARNVDEGQTVAASFQTPTLFLIAEDLTKMKVDASIDEADVGRIKEGMTVTFTVDAYPEENFKGRIIQIRNNPTTIQNVVTYSSVIEVANPDLKLKPGMTANLAVQISQKDSVLKIPNAALRFQPFRSDKSDVFVRASGNHSGETKNKRNLMNHKDKPKIWVLSSLGLPEARTIQLGITDGAFTEVKEGTLQEGDQVITGIEDNDKQKSKSQKMPTMPGRGRF